MTKPNVEVEINFIHKKYGKIGKLQAYTTGINGIVVNRIYEMIHLWTISHQSGWRIGGVYPTKDGAILNANKYFGNLKINLNSAPEDLVQIPDFALAVERLRKKL